jgi:hypothetical protein
MSLAKLERNHFSHALMAKVKKILPKVYRLPELRRGYRLVRIGGGRRYQTKPRLFSHPVVDNAFHQRSPPATGAAAELAEVLMVGWTLVSV